MGNVQKTIRIGGASGYWGDAALATAQLLQGGSVDILVFDYLAEITMGILARMRARDPDAGFATDFVTMAMAPNLAEIAGQGVKIISNAGGVNPNSCAKALRQEIAAQGLSLSVAVVTGDDLIGQLGEMASSDMFSGANFPPKEKISSINAYLGAFPIAKALSLGADIVITGRCVDSALTLGACIDAFDWQADDLDLLAAGSLAGHILECGTQATGGNFTDWRLVSGNIDDIGYPVAEIDAAGLIEISKAKGTDGLVSFGTIAEQMIYEIGDPQAYILPDVTCDFSEVEISEIGDNLVRVSGARGFAPTETYKTCLTWMDGFRGGHLFGFYGLEAEAKAKTFADAAIRRTNATLSAQNMVELSETSVEILGAEAQFGAARTSQNSREVHAKIAVKHIDAKGIALFLREATGLGLSSPPGLTGFAGARPKPSPVMALHSFLWPKTRVCIKIGDETGEVLFTPPAIKTDAAKPTPPTAPVKPDYTGETVSVPLIRLAYGRSGDKGNNANIGVIARHEEFLPYIWQAIDADLITDIFGHFLDGEFEKFLLPGIHAVNIVLHNVLGGGGATSLRNDPQGKGYAQLLLCANISVPKSVLEQKKMSVFKSSVIQQSDSYKTNRADMLALVQKLRALEKRAETLSEKRRPTFEKRGQLTPRERLAALLDPGMPFLELYNLSSYLVDDPDPETSVPGGSMLAGIGFVSGARVMILVDDSGINAGAMTQKSVDKGLGILAIALKQKLPFIHLVESAGANLMAYTVELWAHGGGMFAGLARLSAAGIPVITVLHGASTAGGAYQPGMSDYVIGVRGNGMAMLGGAALVRAATGEISEDQTLGGVEMHAETTGLVEYLADDDAHSIDIARDVIARLDWPNRTTLAALSAAKAKPPVLSPDELAGVVPIDYHKPYDIRELAARLVDGSDMLDFKPAYGPATVCLQARIMGQACGLIGNNGPIDPDGATKATHFLQLCEQSGAPVIFLNNTTGYMVGAKYEHAGMIKHGSKMIQTVTNLKVAKISLYVGASFGAGNYGMCGYAFDPDFLFTWPNAVTGVMGGQQAAGTMEQVMSLAAKRKGVALDEARLTAQSKAITSHFDQQSDAFYTSGRVLDQGMIDPRDTRNVLGFCLQTIAESRARELRPSSFGVARM